MYVKYKIVHAVPGRIRLSIPILKDMRDHTSIQDMFESISGITHVRIESPINAMIIFYNSQELDKKTILKDIGLFFSQLEDDKLPESMDSKRMMAAIIKSVLSGILLLIAYVARNGRSGAGALDYLAVISTSYTVLSHGENRLSHPDVLTGIISMVSLGAQNIMSISFMTWFVNLIEVIVELRKGFVHGVFSLQN